MGILTDVGLDPNYCTMTETSPVNMNEIEEKTHSIAQKILDPAFETVQAGLNFEKVTIRKVQSMQEYASENSQIIDYLLDLTKELNSDSPQLSEKAKELLTQLTKHNINFVNNPDASFSKEQIAALKSNINAQVDHCRMKINQIFMKIQTEMQNMSSVNETVKRIISEASDFIHKVLSRTGRQ